MLFIFEWLFFSGFKFLVLFLSLVLLFPGLCMLGISTLGLSLMNSGLFLFLCVVNLSSLISFTYPLTSFAPIMVLMSLIFWFTQELCKSNKSFQNILLHLVPFDTPIVLVSVMSLIESISSLIRPLTLAVRISANLSAGHVFLTLVSNLDLGACFSGALVLMIFEILVALVQATVFYMLLSVYLSEV